VSLNHRKYLTELQHADLHVFCRSILGFPRMGVNRDLKKATEAYWGGKLSQADLLSEAKRLRLEHWNIQKKAGVDVIPSNDFALYDQVLHQIQDFGVSFFSRKCQD
jgi:5-methyltetrahydropteroyltriglutamate--homocysteine methyltransferase